jgi:hypothetical protein
MRLVVVGMLSVLAWGSVPRPTAFGQEEFSGTMTVFGDLVELAGEIQIRSADDERLQIDGQPILAWSNPTRSTNQKGCVFIWHCNGRPRVIGSVFTFANKVAKMKHELHSLADQSLTAEYRGKVTWMPSKPGITWSKVKDVPSPRTQPRLRLVQMRAIGRQYSASLEEPSGNKSRLEFKPTPLHRYASDEEGVLDGAIFSFALGTDPEVLMLVEATSESDSEAQWRVAFARYNFLKMIVEDHSGNVVWEAKPELDLKSVSMGDPNFIERTYISYHVERRKIEP